MRNKIFISIFMYVFSILGLIAQIQVTTLPSLGTNEEAKKKWGLAIHGGAGTIIKENMTPELEAAYTQKLNEALNVGYALLEKGGSAIDAVEASIEIMEDSPLFNAGKGSVFTNKGTNEMDAAIMDGAKLKAGSVAGVKTVKNPIKAARAVMDKSEHVMLSGEGADAFAKKVGLKIVDQKYFYDEKRWKQWQDVLKAEEKEEMQKNTKEEKGKKEEVQEEVSEPINKKHGTVGCVALDKKGNLAAGTSTGGMTNKKYGRIGDAPVIGAGTYANNKTCAVSCTGHGEFFIRYTVASTVSAMMQYGNKKIYDAANTIINVQLPAVGGEGGLIAIDANGNVTMPFNTSGMYRGFKLNDNTQYIGIYKK
jgi:L-asparaginase / beta-aspartyl-peptidase